MSRRANKEVTMEELIIMMNEMMTKMNCAMEAQKKAPAKKSQKKATKKAAPKAKIANEKTAETVKKVLTDEEKKERREAYLTEKYGDLEHRKAYIAVKNQIAAEMLAEAKASGKYWPKKATKKGEKDYKTVLYERTIARMNEVNQ